jgi:hypothetical protein
MSENDDTEQTARRIRAVRVGHLALFALLLALTAATLGRASAENPERVVLRLPWTGEARP